MSVATAFDIKHLPRTGSTVYVESFGNREDDGEWTRYHKGIVRCVHNDAVTVKLTDFDRDSFTGAFDNRGVAHHQRPSSDGIVTVPLPLVFPTEAAARMNNFHEQAQQCLKDLMCLSEQVLLDEARKAVEAGASAAEIEETLSLLRLSHRSLARRASLNPVAEAEVDPVKLSFDQGEWLHMAKSKYPFSTALEVHENGNAVMRALGFYWIVDRDGNARRLGLAEDCPECTRNLMPQIDAGAEKVFCPNCGRGMIVPPSNEEVGGDHTDPIRFF